jgi:hypothetical protein
MAADQHRHGPKFSIFSFFLVYCYMLFMTIWLHARLAMLTNEITDAYVNNTDLQICTVSARKAGPCYSSSKMDE